MLTPAGVVRDADLSAANTLRLPARAGCFVSVADPAQLPVLRAWSAQQGLRRFVLGGGSNLVLTGDFDGLVLHVAIPGKALAGEDGEAWYVRAGAGECWNEFVLWTLAQGWPGLENLVGIPGSAGAAPIQNIGAYGLEVAERFAWLEAFDMGRGETLRFDRDACRFDYRHSVFKENDAHREGRFVVTSVVFRLPRRWQPETRYADLAAELSLEGSPAPTAARIAAAVAALRRRKLPDPQHLPNAGSFFQNPVVDAAFAADLARRFPALPRFEQSGGKVKLAAAWLIEHAGWKGRRLGPVGMYEKQALVLVKHGEARGADVLALAEAVAAAVRQDFGVELRPEPVYL
ncbi:MAG: UDP-N-acetylmuramate dehydrogenase [Betaproteobacteria bacterium]|nr:UDP-N-acetylmuramate dehydrogenase [Betaproteobacteria bacterium]